MNLKTKEELFEQIAIKYMSKYENIAAKFLTFLEQYERITIMKNLLKKLCFWKKEKIVSFDIETPKQEPKFKWETKEEEVEEDSVDVKVTLFLYTPYIGENPNVEYIFKTYYGYLHHYYRCQAVISGENSYYDWYERNKNVNIISLDGQPYLFSGIKKIVKEDIPVKIKYTRKTEILVEVK